MVRKKIALVAVENTMASFDILFSYIIPPSVEETDKLIVGKRVIVPFGTGNKSRTGFVFKIGENNKPNLKLKPIKQVIDNEPILSEKQLMICEYIVKQTFCTYFDAVNLFIPIGLRIKRKVSYKIDKTQVNEKILSENDLEKEIVDFILNNKNIIKESNMNDFLNIKPKIYRKAFEKLSNEKIIIKIGDWVRRIGDESVKMVRLKDDYFENQSIDSDSDVNNNKIQNKMTIKQKSVLELLENTSASVKEICYYSGVTTAVIDNLVKKGIAEYYEFETFRNPYENIEKISGLDKIILNDAQQSALERIQKLMEEQKANAALLFGVTGSGKTAVFLKAIEKCLISNRNVIVMVPEISLTAQTISRFHEYFGQNIAIMHSGLSIGERLDEWKRIKTEQVKIVIGTRSAVFAPIDNLGLIVIDEEQEHTYKSDKSPRYHARDIAKFRCVQDKATLLLASATPDIESYYNAKIGKYSLIKLEKRFNNSALPETFLINMREKGNTLSDFSLSDILCEEIKQNLENGEQVIILNNRRGFSTTVTCKECKMIETCPNCSISLTYHKVNNQLMCHYCGFSKKIGNSCSACGSELIKYTGAGTQNIQQQLSEIFPQARILRMDQDTTMAKSSHEKFFKAFSNGEYDILVGTQMVAKGLDFPNVTLVGVIGADRSIYSGDFKGNERAFSLITQVVGRCGRGEKKGRAYLQIIDDQNPVLEYGCNQNYEAFYNDEIKIRKMLTYPPFCDICSIGFSGLNEEETENSAINFLEQMKEKVYNKYTDIPLKVLGPSKMAVFKINNKFRYKLIIKCKNNIRFRMLMKELLSKFYEIEKKIGIIIDFSSDINF